MNDQELINALAYRQQLGEAKRIQHMMKDSRTDRPSWSATFLLRIGETLIALGERLKNLSPAVQTIPAAKRTDLSQECA